MKIREVNENKKQFISLLLLADEQESMVDRYLEKGNMYVLEDGNVKAECVVTDEGNAILEIKNTQSQLKDVEKLLKLDPGNTELLAQKQNCPLFIIDKIIHNKVVYRKLMHFHRMPRLPFN